MIPGLVFEKSVLLHQSEVIPGLVFEKSVAPHGGKNQMC